MKIKKQETPKLAKTGVTLKQSKLAGLPQGPEPPEMNAERDSQVEVSEVLQGFKDRAQREDDRVEEIGDSEFWLCVIFQTRAQKEEYLQKLGAGLDEDKYVDGLRLAKLQGITIEAPTPPRPTLRTDQKLSALSLPIKRVQS